MRITVTADAVHVELRAEHRLRFAHQLLDQVAAQATDGRCPSMQVEDHPDVLQHGLTFDISRNRVPTRPTLDRIVELCSLARITRLQPASGGSQARRTAARHVPASRGSRRAG